MNCGKKDRLRRERLIWNGHRMLPSEFISYLLIYPAPFLLANDHFKKKKKVEKLKFTCSYVYLQIFESCICVHSYFTSSYFIETFSTFPKNLFLCSLLNHIQPPWFCFINSIISASRLSLISQSRNTFKLSQYLERNFPYFCHSLNLLSLILLPESLIFTIPTIWLFLTFFFNFCTR